MMARAALVLFGLVAGLILGAPPCSAAQWAFIDENASSTFYYDKSSLQKHDTGKVKVLTRVVYAEKGKDDALKVLGKYRNMEKLFESRYLYDLDCIENEGRLLEVTHLDQEGRVLRSSNLGGVTKWEDLLVDTRMSFVLTEVCPR